MTPQALIALCDDAIERFKSGEFIGDAPTIMLTIPINKPPRGRRVRLLGNAGPLGDLLSVNDRQGPMVAIVAFNAEKVRTFMLPALAAGNTATAEDEAHYNTFKRNAFGPAPRLITHEP